MFFDTTVKPNCKVTWKTAMSTSPAKRPTRASPVMTPPTRWRQPDIKDPPFSSFSGIFSKGYLRISGMAAPSVGHLKAMDKFLVSYQWIPAFSVHNPRGLFRKSVLIYYNRDVLNSAPGLCMEKAVICFACTLGDYAANGLSECNACSLYRVKEVVFHTVQNKTTIHLVTTMLATSKNILLPGPNCARADH